MTVGRSNRPVAQPQDTTRVFATSAATGAVSGGLGGGGMVFADLPASPTLGQRSFITDATASTFYSVAVGGGALPVPVFYDGSDWLVG